MDKLGWDWYHREWFPTVVRLNSKKLKRVVMLVEQPLLATLLLHFILFRPSYQYSPFRQIFRLPLPTFATVTLLIWLLTSGTPLTIATGYVRLMMFSTSRNS